MPMLLLFIAISLASFACGLVVGLRHRPQETEIEVFFQDAKTLEVASVKSEILDKPTLILPTVPKITKARSARPVGNGHDWNTRIAMHTPAGLQALRNEYRERSYSK